MKIEVQKSFEKDILKVKEKSIAQKALLLIEILESYQTVSEIPNLKKLKAKGNYYRIRVGDYRMGLKI